MCGRRWRDSLPLSACSAWLGSRAELVTDKPDVNVDTLRFLEKLHDAINMRPQRNVRRRISELLQLGDQYRELPLIHDQIAVWVDESQDCTGCRCRRHNPSIDARGIKPSEWFANFVFAN